MSGFNGFPSGKMRITSVPSLFFTDLLPQIDHLGELKVTLYVIWAIDQMEGQFRYIRYSDFHSDTRFMEGLANDPTEAVKLLDDGLARATERGALLKTEWYSQSGSEPLYFINSTRGRAALQAIQRGEWVPSEVNRQPVALDLDRPNIYRLYEENIGPLTPMIAETLREAEQTYPPYWIEDAVRMAVENNVRRWRYVEAILQSWQERGRNESNR